MPILIPVNVQNAPIIPLFNMDEFMSRVSQYATELWATMSSEETSKFSRKSNLSDMDLEKALTNLPLYDSIAHDDMSQLTKEDYSYFVRHHNVMKGVEKWL